MLRVLPLAFKPVNNLICCKTGLIWVIKRARIAIQLVLQQYCKTSCMFFVARFCEPLVLSRGWFATLKKRTLRSSNAPLIEISLVKGTFQDSLATLFNTLPASVRRCADFNTFKNNCLSLTSQVVLIRFLSFGHS